MRRFNALKPADWGRRSADPASRSKMQNTGLEQDATQKLLLNTICKISPELLMFLCEL